MAVFPSLLTPLSDSPILQTWPDHWAVLIYDTLLYKLFLFMKALGGPCYTHVHMLFHILGKSCTTPQQNIFQKYNFWEKLFFYTEKDVKLLWQRKLGILKEILQGEANLETKSEFLFFKFS